MGTALDECGVDGEERITVLGVPPSRPGRRGNEGDEMKINFKCKGCKKKFDCDVGQIGINDQTMRPDFEKPIICPSCGERTIDVVLLTELGQSQMTDATWDL